MTLTVGTVVGVTELVTTEGRSVRLRWGPRATVLARVPGVHEAAGAVIDALVAQRGALASARTGIVVVAGDPTAAAAASLPVVDDADGVVDRRLGLDGLMVALVDPYGEVWRVHRPTVTTVADDVADIVQTARFVALQCPECEVPDAPDERLTMEGVHRWR